MNFFKSALFFKIIVIPFFLVLAMGIGMLLYINNFSMNLVEKNVQQFTKDILSTYQIFSYASIAKGQRHAFQEVIDSFNNIQGVKDVFAFNRNKLMLYKMNEKSVGLPFTKTKDGKYVNTNTKFYNQSHGLFLRDDWFYKDLNESKAKDMMFNKVHPKDPDCTKCHLALPKEADFSNGIFIKEEGKYVEAYSEIPVETKCIKCHTHWKEHEPAGYLGVKIDRTFEETNSLKVTNKFILFMIIFIVIIAIIFLLNMLIVKKLQTSLFNLKIITADLAEGEGDLTKRAPVESKDEAGDIAKNLNKFIEKIQKIIQNLKFSIDKSSEVETVVQKATNKTGETVDFQIQIINKNNNDLNKIKSSVELTRYSMQSSTEAIKETGNDLNKITIVLMEIIEQVTEIYQETQQLIKNAEDLVRNSQKIEEIIEIVSEISDQTHLLALNAAIEASRAGEHGQGFAVVADEMQDISQRTLQSVKTVDEVVREVLRDVNDLKFNIQRSSRKSLKVSDSAKSLTTQTTDLSHNLSNTQQNAIAAIKDTSKITDNTNSLEKSFEKLKNSSQQSKEVEIELRKSAKELSIIIEKLNNEVNKFKI